MLITSSGIWGAVLTTVLAKIVIAANDAISVVFVVDIVGKMRRSHDGNQRPFTHRNRGELGTTLAAKKFIKGNSVRAQYQ